MLACFEGPAVASYGGPGHGWVPGSLICRCVGRCGEGCSVIQSALSGRGFRASCVPLFCVCVCAYVHVALTCAHVWVGELGEGYAYICTKEADRRDGPVLVVGFHHDRVGTWPGSAPAQGGRASEKGCAFSAGALEL